MLAAVNPMPATSFQLAPAFAAGQGTVTVGRVEDNVISAIRLNNAAPAQLPDRLINMVRGQARTRQLGAERLAGAAADAAVLSPSPP